MIAAATAGAVVGAVVHQIFVGAILVALLIAASAPLFDRRILGLTDTGVVQARAAAFTTKPTAMLPPPGEVGLTKFGRNAVFDLGGVKYLGATGGRDFAASLTERTPA